MCLGWHLLVSAQTHQAKHGPAHHTVSIHIKEDGLPLQLCISSIGFWQWLSLPLGSLLLYSFPSAVRVERHGRRQLPLPPLENPSFAGQQLQTAQQDKRLRSRPLKASTSIFFPHRLLHAPKTPTQTSPTNLPIHQSKSSGHNIQCCGPGMYTATISQQEKLRILVRILLQKLLP